MSRLGSQVVNNDTSTASLGLLRRVGLRLLEVAHRARPARRMRVVESLACGGKAQLLLVEIDGKSFLAAGGTDAVHTLLALPGESS
ncbi:flagellar biosynthetic protein FliO [Terriglobus saanensis]|nr:flagellar biosynthetic protein FliO [Terriglobus saanensis]